ncbi:TonB-dependent receptor [Sphingobium sufflavum]|uniref:TonB-dependent receptor n=1 Tax=Sphingobium sufflavum TaxID=1129547 RepID=UPI001F17585D|nr:TonB-dependent receptor [Sphingobium sufflavum]MCE7796478.1 TonB-dependent receptor [Sphingobium sufflavum]
MKKTTLLASTIIATTLMSMPAMAQESASQAATAEEGDAIVVTARRREETLQSVPAAVSAVTQESLTRAGATNLADIARMTPGLSFNSGNAGGLAAPTLRGVTNVTTTTFDNNVGVFLDGVYLSGKSNLDIDLFNLARVEVIKGPQSALYGNNAFAGAINYVLDKPSDHLTGRVKATIGTDGLYEVAGKLSGPITDTLRATVVGTYSSFGGTIKNVSSANLGGWKYKWSGSAMLEWSPTDALTASAFYYHYEDKLDGGANYMFTNNCGGVNSNGSTNNRGGSNLRYTCGTLTAPDVLNVDPASYSTRETNLAIGRLAYDFGSVALRYTGSYAKYNTFALQDQHLNSMGGRPTALRRFTQPFVGPVREWSSELRLESYGNATFDWAVGGYYYDRAATQVTIVGESPEQINKSLNNRNVENTKMKSVFGLGTYKFTPDLSLEAQGRWTWEDKSSVLTNFLTNATLRPAAKFSYGTYRVTADWKWATGKSFYAVVASGTKSGGFNNTSVLSEQSFGPEKNTTFEIGTKNSFLGGKVLLNASAFHIDWTNLQLSVPSAVAGQTNPVTNIGSATVDGFEVSADVRPTRNWSMNLGFNYTDPKWKSGTIDYSATRACLTPAACGLPAAIVNGIAYVDISGFQIPRTSKIQYVASGTYTFPLATSDIYIRGDVSYRSAQPAGTTALQDTGDQTLVNARIGWKTDKVEISAFVKNLFDKAYILSSINEPEFVPSTTFTTGFVGNGRQFGLTLDYGF